MEKKAVQGFALITTLGMTALLVMMVVALFQVSRDELSTTRHHHDRVAALYLAEAGLMDAMQELQQDPTWDRGFTQRTIAGVEGYYECQFNTTGTPPYLPSESVCIYHILRCTYCLHY